MSIFFWDPTEMHFLPFMGLSPLKAEFFPAKNSFHNLYDNIVTSEKLL